MPLGYDRNLYILAFDHRGSFRQKVFGIDGRAPTDEENARIRDTKTLISEGFRRALEGGAPEGEAGILVDEEYGADIARTATKEGWVLAMPVEKSGQDVFDFEFGDAFGDHIEDFDPTFSKVLVRYNPADPDEEKRLQSERLRRLSDWLHDRDRKFLFELLVPGTDAQLEEVGGDSARYDAEIRPGLMMAAIRELQEAGVEPDVWKIEGIDRRDDCQAISEVVRRDGRDGVGCVVLGRGADSSKVEHWLQQGAGVPGYLGFAIGRTIWFDVVKAFVEGSIDRREAVGRVADNYLWAIGVYTEAAG